jgi:hypothetical protein
LAKQKTELLTSGSDLKKKQAQLSELQGQLRRSSGKADNTLATFEKMKEEVAKLRVLFITYLCFF